MVKEGPCCHCGIKSTPLWRNGPPSKPVLCNACGSRWRTRGTLNDYVPKHAMYYYNTQMSELPANEDSGYQADFSSPGEASTEGPSDPDFRNVPRRRRSNLDQIVLSPVQRLHKQLYEIAHEEPDVFMKDGVSGDVLINQVDNMMSTPPETALGAMLLNSPLKDIEPTESVSSSSMKTPDASTSQENDDNGGSGGDQGESSFT